MAWFRKKKNAKEVNNENIPKHIAFIADGNGRWAQEKGLPRKEGHKVGKEAIKKVLDRCFERGVEIVSLYCFSTPRPSVHSRTQHRGRRKYHLRGIQSRTPCSGLPLS